ncbi:protein-glutamine gamma-glutamyltransferase K-like [Ylistrum balloti]|uniref:protein-glutamine gamma-glutamyltransferase K-like n=1 Tax=Ylistrum balloti TaxID=509963 RepID=UPI00290584C6|nr:protein-glutamine gamma-glutamyltransferase K-like [Ylistrum balloti]
MLRRPRDHTEGSDGHVVHKRRRYNLRSTRSRRKRLLRLSKEQEGRVKVVTDEYFKSKMKILDAEEKPGSALKVISITNYLQENRRKHHTKEFDQEDLIVRRGQEFKLTIEFDREIDQAHDKVIFQVTYGDQPKESKGSLVRIPVSLSKGKSADMTGCWEVCTLDTSKQSLSLGLTAPPDACIGRYNLFVESNLKEEDKAKRYKCENEVIILFNPWCTDDTVYLAEPAWRKEYVLNEEGNVWVGSWNRNFGKNWNFGQFSEPCLEAALFLLDKGELADSGRGSPVSIVRCISSLANSMDDHGGVLEGRWTETYPPECVRPWEWSGSVNILKKYMETLESVQYGQCWVFSCLVTTLLRSLGIPTRSVTNFESAHDTDCSMTIDFHCGADGFPEDALDDSKWNFHVWNESWFRRLDLPSGYDGWQAHDGTPQELSEGVMRCGPAPLKAIKEGHVYLNYDVGFVFSEVNGDKINWQINEDGSMEVTNIDKFAIGKNISTKAIGSSDREDVTGLYKYPEGSVDERRVVKFVNQFGSKRKERIYEQEPKKEVDLELDLPNNTMIGEDVEIKVKVINLEKEDRKVHIRITVLNAYYTGIAGRRVKTEKMECVIPGNRVETVTMMVTGKEYEKKRNPEGRFQVYANVKNVSNNRMHVLSEVLMLATPDLTVDIPTLTPYMTDTPGKVVFHNITNITLTNGMFSCDAGSGLMSDGFKIPIKKPISPGEYVTEEFMLCPNRRYSRRRRLTVTFNSDQLVNVEGSAMTKIVNTPKKEDDETDSSDDED